MRWQRGWRAIGSAQGIPAACGKIGRTLSPGAQIGALEKALLAAGPGCPGREKKKKTRNTRSRTKGVTPRASMRRGQVRADRSFTIWSQLETASRSGRRGSMGKRVDAGRLRALAQGGIGLILGEAPTAWIASQGLCTKEHTAASLGKYGRQTAYNWRSLSETERARQRASVRSTANAGLTRALILDDPRERRLADAR